MMALLRRCGTRSALWLLLTSPALAQCELNRLVAPDAALRDRFGLAVAVWGDRGLVGAPDADAAATDSGAAYVVQETGTGWTVGQKLTASDGAAYDRFGSHVAMQGDHALIAALREGVVYAFERGPNGWVEVQQLVSSDQPRDGWFGSAIAMFGDLALIGAEQADGNLDDVGAAYVFERGPSGWTETAKLVAPDPFPGDDFGSAAALGPDTAVIGAQRHTLHGFNNKGAAWVFERGPAGWSFSEKLSIYEGNQSDRFGGGIAIDRDRVLISATGALSPAGNYGIVYLFRRTAGGWEREHEFFAQDDETPTTFGKSVALEGSKVLISAEASGEEDFRTGRVFAYGRVPVEWELEAGFGGTATVPSTKFGASIAVWGDTLLVGAPGGGDLCDSPFECNSGAAFAFSLPIESSYQTCAGIPNSTGAAARIVLAGCALVSSNDLEATASPVPSGTPGLFFYGDSSLPPIPFGDGTRCVGGRTFRLPLQQASGDALVQPIDFTTPPQPGGQITAGSTWYFQAWFRDTAAGGAGFNLSSALAIDFH